MNPKIKTLLFFLVGAFAGILMMYLITNYRIEKKDQGHQETSQTTASENNASLNKEHSVDKPYDNGGSETNIKELTDAETVIAFVKAHQKLPDYYITKSEAKNQGWIASKGNLCDVLPGKAIGGDKFSNREKQLPKGEQNYEADVNYNCGNRGADRIVFTKNGKVWLTKNHYKSFDKQ